MKVHVEQKSLLKALSHVQSVVERRNTIPILSNVLLSALGDCLSLSTTDLDMEMREGLRAAVHVPGDVTVPAALLHDIVRKMPAGAELALTYSKDDPRLLVSAGRSRFHLPVLPAGDYPSMTTEGLTSRLELKSADLRGLIDKTRFAISTEETRYYLNGLYVHTVSENGETKLRAVATDGHRLALAEMPAPEGAEGMPSVIVPRKTIGELRKLLDDADHMVTLALSASKIHADLGFATLTSKVIDGSFPDYSRVIPKDNSNILTVDVELLAGAVDRVATISQEKARSVKLGVKPGALTLAVKNMEAGQGLDELEVDYTGPEFDIGFNARYVLDVCQQLKGESAELRMADSASPALVVNPADLSARYVIMPLRV